MIRILSVALFGLLLSFSCQAQKKLTSLGPIESYPDDTFLASATEKRAMVVVAHDDDSGAMSGVMAKLHSQGWEIVHVCFAGDDEVRRNTHRLAVKHITDRCEFIPMAATEYRNDIDTATIAYLPIAKSAFDSIFNSDPVRQYLLKTINEFRPTVIFTLDDEIGGYGHPEHVFISSMVRQLAESGEISPKRIYQATYTPHMEEQIVVVRLGKLLKRWGFPNTFELAKEVYQVDGMPDPTVQINIQDQGEEKMLALRSYGESERRGLRKFIPYFEDYPAKKYFSVFDREFYRVVEF